MASAPKAPTPPDAYKTAAAQGAVDVNTAIAESRLRNAWVESPEGATKFVDATDELGNPITRTITFRDAAGAVIGTESVETQKQIITYAPAVQQIFDVSNSVKIALNEWALAQVGILKGEQTTVLSLSGLPALPDVPMAPAVESDIIVPGALVTSIGSINLLSHLDTLRQSLLTRLMADIERDRLGEVVRLSLMGLSDGMEGYDRVMDQISRRITDARLQVEQLVGQEQSRMIGLEATVGQFANQTQEQAFRQAVAIRELRNSNLFQMFRAQVERGQYVVALRERQLAEEVTIRGHNVNQVSALIHGGQVQTPRFAGWEGSQIKSAPVAESVYRSYAAELDIWKTQVANQQNMLGGILGFGGNLVGGLIGLSDRRLKVDIAPLGRDAKGVAWYSFRYLWEAVGARHIGVMAQEVAHIPGAVVQLAGSWLAVDYRRVM